MNYKTMRLEDVNDRLAELRQNAPPPNAPFEASDVEYLELLARKLELGHATFNPRWFEQMAKKIDITITRAREEIENLRRERDQWKIAAERANSGRL